jgi:predicted glycosyltransferase involved in capsule biosynthesis
MHNLEDVTFTIPIKIDQPDRLRNLRICLNYLRGNFNTKLIVCELDKESKARPLLEGMQCKYIFMKTDSAFFHRTMMLNYMAKQADTNIIVNYDCDVLLPIENYIKATELIRSNEAEMVYPYDGNFYDVNPEFIDGIEKSNSISNINPNTMCKNLRPEANSVGGAIFWSKKSFFKFGQENENCVSWGYEDNERFERALKLGIKITRCKNGLIHLHHGASLNSSNGSHPFYQKNEQEWQKVKHMSTEDLNKYIKTWTWNRE